MKRHNNLFEQIISVDNLELADINARRGKSNQACIKRHDENRKPNIKKLHLSLRCKRYTTSDYTTFTIKEPKERLIYRLPYYPDRIVQHAVMNITMPIFLSTFTNDTYSCIKKRGVHKALGNLTKSLKNVEGTKYCLKIDIKKFYPSIDHDILKNLLRKKFKDKDLLWLFDDIIDSADGLPIGNYLSQYLANFYLTYFDHWIKEVQGVTDYFRYADDMVFLSDSKSFLHKLLHNIKKYLTEKLNLTVKENYQVFLVESRGIDFLGYVAFHDRIRIRKKTKQNFARKLKRGADKSTIYSYLGLLKHGNCINLKNKLLNVA